MTAAWAEYGPPDVDLVPLAKVIENLQRALKSNPGNAEAWVNLGRAYVLESTVPSASIGFQKGTQQIAWAPDIDLVPVSLRARALPTAEEAEKKAIGAYRQAWLLRPHDVKTELGLYWLLDKRGLPNIEVLYRDLLERLEVEHEASEGLTARYERFRGRPLIAAEEAEVAGYLAARLDPVKDAVELGRLTALRAAGRAGRPISPIVVPLEDQPASAFIAPGLAHFDVDASGVDQRWSWPTASFGFLVFDPAHTGQIHSGLQLFGSVTFFMFWENGYHALATLDDDGDGSLRDAELDALSIWRDSNQNGVSDPGEVTPVHALGITAISCEGVSSTNESLLAWNPRGVTFDDGSTRATGDLLLHATP